MVVASSQEYDMATLIRKIDDEVSKLQNQTFSIGGVDVMITRIERTATGFWEIVIILFFCILIWYYR